MGSCQTVKGNLTVVLSYLQSDLIKKQRSFKIGLVSIFLVVWFTAMLMNLISLNCLIFMRLVEDSVGEADFVFTPFLSTQDTIYRNSSFENLILNKENRSTDYFNIKFIEFMDLKEKLKGITTLQGIAPRWFLRGNTTNFYDNKTSWAVSNLLVLDSALENKQAMGRKLNIHKLNEGECYVSSSLYNSLKLKYGVNDNITIDVKLSALLEALGKFETEEEEEEEEERNDANDLEWHGENYRKYLGKINGNRRYKHNYKSNNNEYDINSEYSYDSNDIINEGNPFNSDFNSINNSPFKENQKEPKVPKKLRIKDFISSKTNIKENMKKIIHLFLQHHPSLNNEISLDMDRLSIVFQLSSSPREIEFSLSLITPSDPLIPTPKDDPFSKQSVYPQIKFLRLLSSSPHSRPLLQKIITIDPSSSTFKFKENIPSFKNVSIPFSIPEILNCFTDEELDNILSFQHPFKVREDISSSSGKWPSSSGNVVAVDANYMRQYLINNFCRAARIIADKVQSEFVYDVLEQMTKNIMKDFDIFKYTLSVNGVLKDKFAAYSKTGSKLRLHMVHQADNIMKTLGYEYPIDISVPIFKSYEIVTIAQIMLVNIFRAVMVFLWILDIILVYSLMLGNVDERTYEFGMLRSMGFKKINLVTMIIIQGIIFAIPGIILGFLTAYLVNNYIEFWLNDYSGLTMPYFLSGKTIGLATATGLLIVLISSFFPIKKALDANLKETLTIFNKKALDTVVSMIKLDRLGISPTSLVASLVLIIVGISTYYIGPSSFIKLNPDIFIFIMIMILIMMIIGLILIVQVFMPKIQEGILYVIMLFAFKDKNLHFLVKKNLYGHGKRNKKVSIMFMVALSFVIFGGCTLNLVVQFIQTLTKSFIGGDCAFFVIGFYDSLNQNDLESYMKETMEKFPNLVHNYTFLSCYLKRLIGVRTSVGALNGYPSRRRKITAVDENFVYSGYKELYAVGSYDHNLNYSYIEGTKTVDLVSMLYLNDYVEPIIPSHALINYPIDPNSSAYKLDIQVNMLIAEGLRKRFAISTSNPASLRINTTHLQRVPVKIVGLAKKLPGLPAYSSYNTLAFMSSGLISMKQLKEIVDKETKMYPEINATFHKFKGVEHTPDGIPKRVLFVKFKDHTDEKLRNMFFAEVKNIFDRDGALSIILDDIIKTTNKAHKIMSIIILILGIIALILSFFLIWTTFYCNIKENICEYGILRAVGLTKLQAMRMFLYEALAIILSSIVTGTVIGIVISVTLILQFNVFVELPFIFNFPWQLYLILVIFGLVMGMLGSYYPVAEVNHLSLVKIMKGLSE